MRMMFEGADSFNQDISDWNVSIVTRMNNMFGDAVALSDSNKGMIEASFSSNSNWSYDWSGLLPVPINDTNFQTAVDLWFDDEVRATATYGHISDWNVSAVTNMFGAFEIDTLLMRT